MTNKKTKETTMSVMNEIGKTLKTPEQVLQEKTKVEVKYPELELKNINDTLLELYNTPGMALQFQPSNLKILKKQIERLIVLEEILYGKAKPIQTSKGIKI
jgi:hypothetical protein